MKEKVKSKVKEVRTKFPPFIKTNLYAVTDVMLVFALLLFLASIFEKDKKAVPALLAACGVSVIVGSSAFVSQILQGKTTVKNRSKNSICAKPEEGSDTFNVLPGENGYDIDGIKSNGVVYKIGDSCHAKVSDNGTVKVKSFTGKIVNKIIGGGVLTSPPDDSWQKLFDC
jgi:hypothetical protein